MATLNVSEDTHVKIMDQKTHKYNSVKKIVAAILDGSIKLQENLMDYSNCPNCKVAGMKIELYRDKIKTLEKQIELMPQEEQIAQDRINEIKKDGHKIALTNSDDDEEDK